MRARFAAAGFVALLAGAAAAQDAKPPEAPPPAEPAGPSLKIETLQQGSGREVKEGDDVLVQLAVSLADTGKVLMDTRREPEPQLFHVGSNWTAPAIDQVLLKMRQGERVKATAPYQLGWGERGYPGAAPPKTDVVLDIEVVGFVEMKTEVLKSGDGPTPLPSSYVLVHVVSTLPDGKVIQDTRKEDEPILFVLGAGQILKGWEATIRRMKVGDRWKVAMPWQLAYGAKGREKLVPPKTDVVFDFERMPLPEPKIDVLVAGTGAGVRPGQTVTLHLTSSLPDGAPIDDTRKGGKPLAFVLGARQVVPALELLVARMRVGDRWKAVVPWQTAYGARGHGPVPPKTNVAYDVEIVEAR